MRSFRTAANSLDREKRQLGSVTAILEQAFSSFRNIGGESDGDGDDDVDKNAYEFAKLKPNQSTFGKTYLLRGMCQ